MSTGNSAYSNVGSQRENRTGKCLGTVYDIISQIISLLDVITDVIVCIGFYQHGRTVFFGLSLTILILALVGYSVLFVHLYSNTAGFTRETLLFFRLLLISPLLPFMMFYLGNDTPFVGDLIEVFCCGHSFDFSKPSITEDASKLKQFFQSKIRKHAGFVLESLIEGTLDTFIHSLHDAVHFVPIYTNTAFPQAIIQMAAIVIYKESNIAAIISILISLLSIASKSLVFSMGTAVNMKQLFFNWLSAVTDFISIFFVVSWVFYEPHSDDLKPAFATIQPLWLWKLYLFEIPMVVIPSTVIYITYIMALVTEKWDDAGCCKRVFIAVFGLIAFSFILACTNIAGILILEITTWTYIALLFNRCGTIRYPTWHKASLELYFTCIEFIKSAETHRVGTRYKSVTSFTKKQDKMMRLCSVNYVLSTDGFLEHNRDTKFLTYLDEQQQQNQYMNVSMSALRVNNNAEPKSTFTARFWKWYGYLFRDLVKELTSSKNRQAVNPSCKSRTDTCFFMVLLAAISSLTFFFGPLYFMFARTTTLLFPAFIVLYFYIGFGVNIWTTTEIELFQVVMISTYMILCAVLSILFYLNATEQYLMFHIVPQQQLLREFNDTEVEQMLQNITNHYYNMRFVPIRKAIVIEHFGIDIGTVIVSFLPVLDDYDAAATITRAKVV